jgi:hypothetical protein
MYVGHSLTHGLHLARREPLPTGLMLTVAVSVAGLVVFALSVAYVPGFATMVATALTAAG